MHINIVFLLEMMKEVPFLTSPRVDPTMCPLTCVQWGTCKLTDGLCILKGIVSKPQRSLFGSLTHVQDITNYLSAHPQANEQILQTFYTSLVWPGIKRSRLSTAPCTSVYSWCMQWHREHLLWSCVSGCPIGCFGCTYMHIQVVQGW